MKYHLILSQHTVNENPNAAREFSNLQSINQSI